MFNYMLWTKLIKLSRKGPSNYATEIVMKQITKNYNSLSQPVPKITSSQLPDFPTVFLS